MRRATRAQAAAGFAEQLEEAALVERTRRRAVRRDATQAASKAPPPPSRFVRAASLGRTVPPQPKKRAAEAPAAAAADLAGGLWPIVLNPLSSVRQLGRDLEKSHGERSLATNGLPSSGDMSPGARGLAWLEGLDYWLHAEGPERDRRQDAAAALEDLRRRAALRGNALKELRHSLRNPAAGEGAWKGLIAAMAAASEPHLEARSLGFGGKNAPFLFSEFEAGTPHTFGPV